MSIEGCMNTGNSNVVDNQLPRNKPRASTYYIMSACNFAALGLSTLLQNSDREVIIYNINIHSYLNGSFHRPCLGFNCRVIVYLPDDPFMLLVTLKFLEQLIKTEKSPVAVLLLSRLQPLWLYRTLQNLAPGKKKISAVRAIKPDTDTFHMLRLLKKDPDTFPLLEQLAQEENRNNKLIIDGVTKRELDVMLKLLSGNSMMEQSIDDNLSVKTLYSQKVSGIRKLSTQFTSLAKLLPGRERILQRMAVDKPSNNVRPEDNSLTEAVRRGLFFQVYQPVTDREMKVKGFETLSRWYKDGKVLLPMEFLPLIRTENSWITLTACVIKDAIEKINQFKGEYWFSVNIPACLSGSPALLRMLSAAKKQLSNPGFLDKLILEFSEDIDWSKNSPSVAILRELYEQKYRVFLDYCFSDSAVAFPVRKVNFNGYKLDTSVVNSAMYNIDDYHLIKGLAYYSQLTGSQCVAEGVDTYEKFVALKDMGVTAFQGSYFSRPALGEELDIVISKFKKTDNKLPTSY